MIRIAEIRDGRTLEVEVSGKLTGEDYNEVLVPSIQSMFSEFGKLKLIIILQRDFDGFDFQAMWSDLKMSILHWNSFDRIAIITDKTWVKNIYHHFSAIMPCPTSVFDVAEADDARRWIHESLGAVHIHNRGSYIEIRPMGEIDQAILEAGRSALVTELNERTSFSLLLDLRDFNGWNGLSAMLTHFRIGKNFYPSIEKVAVLAEPGWKTVLPQLLARLLNVDVLCFEQNEMDEVKHYLA